MEVTSQKTKTIAAMMTLDERGKEEILGVKIEDTEKEEDEEKEQRKRECNFSTSDSTLCHQIYLRVPW